jgi:hypothetical protein
LIFGALLTYDALEFNVHGLINFALTIDALGALTIWRASATQKLAAQPRDEAYRKAGLAPPGTRAP